MYAISILPFAPTRVAKTGFKKCRFWKSIFKVIVFCASMQKPGAHWIISICKCCALWTKAAFSAGTLWLSLTVVLYHFMPWGGKVQIQIYPSAPSGSTPWPHWFPHYKWGIKGVGVWGLRSGSVDDLACTGYMAEHNPFNLSPVLTTWELFQQGNFHCNHSPAIFFPWSGHC